MWWRQPTGNDNSGGLRGRSAIIVLMARFFETPDELRAWFDAHHQSEPELIVGFRKAGSAPRGITWAEAVDEALCVGWIDAVRRGIDEGSYSIRFCPRKPSSIWSAVNIANVARLSEQGRMRPAGLAAFERRTEQRSRVYSHERTDDPELTADEDAALRADAAGWAYFSQRAPSYRRTALHWVVSAKRADTRARRLAALIADNAEGRPLKQFDRRAASP